jgi:hypothetical protein
MTDYELRDCPRCGHCCPQPNQEPVAWMHVQGNYTEPSFRPLMDDEIERGWEQYPLYSTQRPWVGLTDTEIGIEYVKWDATPGASMADFARAIETKLQEKNT